MSVAGPSGVLTRALQSLDFDSFDLEDCMLGAYNQTCVGVGGKGKGKGKGKKTAAHDVNSDDASNLASRVVELLVPVLTSTFKKAFTTCLKSVITELVDGVSAELKTLAEKTQKSNLLLRYEQDRLEQYQRRDTVRVVGLKEEEKENIEEKFLGLCEDVGVNIKPEDISCIHRTGPKRTNAARPVLVKFVSRQTKSRLMAKKKDLKKKPQQKGVYLNDDLTPLRSKMLYLCKQTPGVERVSTTHDGKIACHMKGVPGSGSRAAGGSVTDHSSSSSGGSGVTHYIDTPDDLFKLGIKDVDYAALGLRHFTVA